jgi:hypothetical protein
MNRELTPQKVLWLQPWELYCLWVFNWELFGHCSVLIGLSCLISTLKVLWSRSLVTSLLVSVRDGPSFSFLEFGKYNFLVLWSTWLHPNGSAYFSFILSKCTWFYNFLCVDWSVMRNSFFLFVISLQWTCNYC